MSYPEGDDTLPLPVHDDHPSFDTTANEEDSLLRRSDAYLDDAQINVVPSAASLSSFVDMRVDKLASVPEVIMNTFKSFVGSGILGLPYGFSKGGWALSLMAFPVASIIAGFCLLDLIDCKV